jgi:IS30 family transposase
MRKIGDHAARRIMRRGTQTPLLGGDLDGRRRHIIHDRPRQTLGYRTPCEKMNELVALTA